MGLLGLIALAAPPGTHWEVETVAENGAGLRAPMVIAPDDAIHTVWHSKREGRLVHAWKYPETEWFTEEVVSGRGKGVAPGLGRGPSGNLHILAFHQGRSTLVHFRKEPGTRWREEDVSLVKGVAGDVKVVVDASGVVHGAYVDSFRGVYVHVWKSPGGEWDAEYIDQSAMAPHDLVLAPDGTLHAGFRSEGNGYFKHAWKKPGMDGWAARVVFLAVAEGHGLSLAAGSGGDVWAAFRTPAAPGTLSLWLGKGEQGRRWASEIVVEGAGWGGGHALDVTQAGVIHLSHMAFNRVVHQWRKEGGDWEVLEGPSDAKFPSAHLSLALDAEGNPQVFVSTFGNTLHRVWLTTPPEVDGLLKALPVPTPPASP